MKQMNASAIVAEHVRGSLVHAKTVAMSMPEQVTGHTVLVQK